VVCQELGLQYISPQWPVEPVIHQLRSCKAVITEAMHGAIICDAFRIPWSRVTINAWQKEDFDVSTLKWLDWGLSLRADVTPVHLEPQHEWGRRMLANPLKLLERLASRRQLLKDLRQFVKTKKFYLSEEPLLKNATERIAAEIARLKSDYAAG
jgi:succinoglycan biosynthesis protein ExoV